MTTPENIIGQQPQKSISEHISLENNSLPIPRKTTLKDISNLTPKELIEQNIRTELSEDINIGKIHLDRAIVDDPHANELGKSMKQDRGQLTPILVRARLVKEEIEYDIIDGFHRTLGGIREGFYSIKATVIYGCNDQEMYDLRILAANSVKSVQFARLAEWIKCSYNTTDFSNKLGVCQAFALTVNDSERCNTTNLMSEEIKEIKQWVNEKSEFWRKTPASIYQDLLIISEANPDLVKKVRTASGGKERAKLLTKDKLKQVVDRFPGKENYQLQKIIIDYANKNKLQRIQIKDILDNLENSTNIHGSTDEQILNIIKNTRFEEPVKTEKTKHERKNNKKPDLNIDLQKITDELEQTKIELFKKDKEIKDLEEKINNNPSFQEAIKSLSNWVDNTKYSLSENEKKAIRYFLYNPDAKTNVFNFKNNSYTSIEKLIMSAILKKITIDQKIKNL